MEKVVVLGEATGIQNNGITDRTTTNAFGMLNGPVIVGVFKRGRTDKPMTVHSGNIRGQLGYDPNNPNYMAVQAMLDAKVPMVQVMRVAE